MAILGSLIAIAAAVAFGAVAVFVVWGSIVAHRSEVAKGFVSSPPAAPAGRLLTLVGLWVALLGAAVLSGLAAIRIFQVAFGLG
ncbi:MAG: hypothetical protein MUD01_07450 [Chloroflexaceae bacterium]|nr:hypothetical protein [Chloroflexaceae bacterium]